MEWKNKVMEKNLPDNKMSAVEAIKTPDPIKLIKLQLNIIEG